MSAVDDDLEPTSTAPNSVWADLRRQHERIASDVDPLYLPIPGYNGIVAKYRYVELDETKASSNAAARIRDITDQARTASIDSLILALDEIQMMAADGVRPTGRGGNVLFDQPLKSL
ncbi:MAG: hypothetical protein JWM93_864, partial [Frankiales bacterium]|nr:hypothetical protein [Frankiales bacterium]